MGRREDLLRREAEGWARLERATAGLDEVELARPGVMPEGWAIRDVWWHLGYWFEDTARVLGEMREGTWDGGDPSTEPGWTDRVNAEGFERSRAMSVDEVRAALAEGRRHHLEAFGELDDVTPAAEEWFDESGPLHYEEHAPSLEAWADELRAAR